jgi:hypothetical protein
MRRLVQSALCLFLSPLLAAQQTPVPASSAEVPAQIELDLTGGRQVQFLSTSVDSLGKIRRGHSVQIELTADATYGGEVVIPAWVPVNGVVVKIYRARRDMERDGQLFIKMPVTVSGKQTNILIRCTNPAAPYENGFPSERAQKWRVIVVIAICIAGMIVGARYDGR